MRVSFRDATVSVQECALPRFSPVLTSGTGGCFHSCALLRQFPETSALTGQRKGAFDREKNETDPLPDSLSWRPPSTTIFHYLFFLFCYSSTCLRPPPPSAPLSSLPAFTSGRALITEFPGNCPNRPSCVAMSALFLGHKSGLSIVFFSASLSAI